MLELAELSILFNDGNFAANFVVSCKIIKSITEQKSKDRRNETKLIHRRIYLYNEDDFILYNF